MAASTERRVARREKAPSPITLMRLSMGEHPYCTAVPLEAYLVTFVIVDRYRGRGAHKHFGTILNLDEVLEHVAEEGSAGDTAGHLVCGRGGLVGWATRLDADIFWSDRNPDALAGRKLLVMGA